MKYKFGAWLLLSLLISVGTYWRWIFTDWIFTWGDWGFFYQETAKQWLTLPQSWSYAGLGSVDIGLPLYPTARLALAVFSQVFDYSPTIRLVYLFPSAIFPSLSIFLLVWYVTRNKVAAFIGSLVYSYNSYILVLNTGHLTLSVAYAIGPLVFIMFSKALSSKSYFWSVATALVAGVASAYEIRAFYLIALILGAYAVYKFFSDLSNRNLKYVTQVLVTFCIIAALNAYWIPILLLSPQSFSEVALNQPLFGQDHVNIIRSLTLFHPFWTGSEKMAFGLVQPVPWYFWFIPFLAFFGFWLNRRRPEIIFWFGIALAGIFLSKQANHPFSAIYHWLFKHFPGFNAFRESSKFYYYTSVSYAVLIGSLVTRAINQKTRLVFKALVTLGISSIFLINTRPVILGQLGKIQTPRVVPTDYQIFNKFIQNQPEFFRVLYLPSISRWNFTDFQHRNISAIHALQTFWRGPNNYLETGLKYSTYDESTNIFLQPFADQLLDSAAVKYIVIPPTDIQNEEVFIYPANYGPPDYAQTLDSLPYLSRVSLPTSEMIIYENFDYLDLFNAQSVNFSPTRYDIILNNSLNTLKFSERYHPGWKIRIGTFNWWEALTAKDYSLPDASHFQTEFGLNEFNLPPLPPGTQITVYFAPQAWINLGALISLTTFTVLLFLLPLWLVHKPSS